MITVTCQKRSTTHPSCSLCHLSSFSPSSLVFSTQLFCSPTPLVPCSSPTLYFVSRVAGCQSPIAVLLVLYSTKKCSSFPCPCRCAYLGDSFAGLSSSPFPIIYTSCTCNSFRQGEGDEQKKKGAILRSEGRFSIKFQPFFHTVTWLVLKFNKSSKERQ